MSTTTTESTTPSVSTVEELFTGFTGDGSIAPNADRDVFVKTSGEIAPALLKVRSLTESLGAQYRAVCVMLLTIRSMIVVTRHDGTTGPDWAADSQLARDWTTLAVSEPCKAKGMTDAEVRKLLNSASAYMSKTEGDTGYSLRENFIRSWAKGQHLNEEGELTATEAEVSAIVEGEHVASKTTSKRMKAKALADKLGVNEPGPNDKNPPSAVVTLEAAADAVTTSEANLSEADLIAQAHRILSRVAAQRVTTKGGNIAGGKAKANAALAKLAECVAAIQESYDGKTESFERLNASIVK